MTSTTDSSTALHNKVLYLAQTTLLYCSSCRRNTLQTCDRYSIAAEACCKHVFGMLLALRCHHVLDVAYGWCADQHISQFSSNYFCQLDKGAKSAGEICMAT